MLSILQQIPKLNQIQYKYLEALQIKMDLNENTSFVTQQIKQTCPFIRKACQLKMRIVGCQALLCLNKPDMLSELFKEMIRYQCRLIDGDSDNRYCQRCFARINQTFLQSQQVNIRQIMNDEPTKNYTRQKIEPNLAYCRATFEVLIPEAWSNGGCKDWNEIVNYQFIKKIENTYWPAGVLQDQSLSLNSEIYSENSPPQQGGPRNYLCYKDSCSYSAAIRLFFQRVRNIPNHNAVRNNKKFKEADFSYFQSCLRLFSEFFEAKIDCSQNCQEKLLKQEHCQDILALRAQTEIQFKNTLKSSKANLEVIKSKLKQALEDSIKEHSLVIQNQNKTEDQIKVQNQKEQDEFLEPDWNEINEGEDEMEFHSNQPNNYFLEKDREMQSIKSEKEKQNMNKKDQQQEKEMNEEGGN